MYIFTCFIRKILIKHFQYNFVTFKLMLSSDGTINWNRVSEILGVFLESESEKVDLISYLTNDSS